MNDFLQLVIFMRLMSVVFIGVCTLGALVYTLMGRWDDVLGHSLYVGLFAFFLLFTRKKKQ